MSTIVNDLQYLAITGLAYNYFPDLINPDTHIPWTVGELALAGKIDGFTINPVTNQATSSKPELAELANMLNWTLVNSEDNTASGFAGVAFKQPVNGTDLGQIVIGLRGTELTGKPINVVRDIVADGSVAIGASTISISDQFNDAYDFYNQSLTVANGASVGGFNGYSFTGHSLGGGLASYLTYRTHNIGRSVTFNAVGIGQILNDANLPALTSFNVVDYVNEYDIIGQFGQQLGSTVYLTDNGSGVDKSNVANAAIWYGLSAALFAGRIPLEVGAIIISNIAHTIDSDSKTFIDDISNLTTGSHNLEFMLSGSGLSYSFTSHAVGSEVSGLVSVLSGVAEGASVVIDGVTYIQIFSNPTAAIAYAVDNGSLKVLTTLGANTTELILSFGATVAEVAHNVGNAIKDLSGDALNAVLGFLGTVPNTINGTAASDDVYGLYNLSNVVYGKDGNDMIYGANLKDILSGNDGNDIIYAQDGDDYVFGNDGNDTIYGGTGNDTVFGGADDDALYGDSYAPYHYSLSEVGNDVLDGGAGNDLLVGDGGDDTYIFGLGYGQDVIVDRTTVGSYYDQRSANAGFDTISFLEGVDPAQVTVKRQSSDLVFSISGTADTLTVQGFYSFDNYTAAGALYSAIERVQFKDANNTVWTLEDLLQKSRYIEGTPSDDIIAGFSDREGYGDIIAGGSGNDTINAGANDDQVNAGSGNDIVRGGGGSDLLSGASGDDTLYGDDVDMYGVAYGGIGNDILDGGSGNDILMGGAGNDTYAFGRGYGQDSINDTYRVGYYYSSQHVDAGFDTISMMAGVDPGDISVIRNGNDLILRINGTPDQITSQNFFNRDNYASSGGLLDAIEQVTFQDTNNTVWTQADLLEKARYINGTAVGETVYGYGDQSDILFAGAGDDVVYTSAGDDQVDAGEGNDIVFAGSGNDTLLGGAGDDVLYGDADSTSAYGENVNGTGNDTLDGGMGNDLIKGSGGNDTYIFGLGYGQDIIVDSLALGPYYNQSYVDAGFDTISFKSNIDPSDVNVERQGDNLVFKIAGTTDSLTVQNFFTYNNGALYQAVEQVVFNDTNNTVWNKDDLLEKGRVINGTQGDDTIYAYNTDDIIHAGAGNDSVYAGLGNDVLDGGSGNDELEGASGNDTYVFGAGFGIDTIYDSDSTVGNIDKIVFESNIAPEDVLVGRVGDDLQLSIIGSADKLTVEKYFSEYGRPSGWMSVYVGSGGNQVEEVHFSDGTIWDVAAVKDKARYINGTQADEYLYGLSGQQNVINAGDGNDHIYAGALGDVLYGGSGNDEVNGGYGNDTLAGGTGTDQLNGGFGNDTYQFNRGDGIDTIYDSDSTVGNSDTVTFGAGIVPGDITAIRNDDNLELRINGTTDKLVVERYFSQYSRPSGWSSQYVGDNGNKIEVIQFADGSSWNINDVKAKVSAFSGTNNDDYIYGYSDQQSTISGLDGNDVIYAGSLGDTLVGGSGNDDLHGAYGADNLNGGVGNDSLQGGSGNDTYVFGVGYGTDTIYDFDTTVGNVDTISFMEGINSADVTVSRNGDDLEFRMSATDDLLIISKYYSPYQMNYYNYNYGVGVNKVERVIFADNTVWTTADIEDKARHINGTASDDYITAYDTNDIIAAGAGNDIVYAGSGSDQLYGGDGNDILYGQGGSDLFDGGTGNDDLHGDYTNDTYIFSGDYGNDTITDYGDPYYQDKVAFGEDRLDLVFGYSGNNLQITTVDSTNSLTVNYWQQTPYYQIEKLQDTNGYVITNAQVDQLIQAMATFSGNNNGMTWQQALDTNNQDAQALISQYWTMPTA